MFAIVGSSAHVAVLDRGELSPVPIVQRQAVRLGIQNAPDAPAAHLPEVQRTLRGRLQAVGAVMPREADDAQAGPVVLPGCSCASSSSLTARPVCGPTSRAAQRLMRSGGQARCARCDLGRWSLFVV